MLENYSPKIRKALKAIKIGDRIYITKGKKRYEGLLMPRTETGDSNSIVLKLDNGYNIGIRFEGKAKMQRSKKPEPKEIKEEVEFELGKEKIKKIRFDPKKPKVSLIMTGGTIISRVDYRTGGVRALEKPEELLTNIPELKDIVNIKNIISPFKKMSEDLNYKDWQILAKLAAKELNKSQGVIITQGTDTLHFTSAVLSFMLKNLYKPVVFTASQRSSDRGSSDAFSNLICSAHTAVSDIGELGVCMHASTDDHYCYFIRGTKVRKMHSTRRDAFRSINEIPLAKIWPNGKIDILNKNHKKRKDEKVVADTKFEPKVALLKAYPGSEPEILEFLVKKGYKGFVIEGTGMGHVPTFAEKPWIPVIKKLIKDGIPVVIAPQTIYGRINTNVYSNLRVLFHEAKAIPAEDMLPETAYIKLGWVLGHTKDLEKVRELMLTNIAGEITERTEIDTFLV
ncbi:MAG: Glu-tRNA(Gln) amidotransferase subunit GatD [Candidatus Aenigmarchaeota archaeon]|nr:Glu-tRNA(Gln) amidotransferase subunit GatD [Candidatus Aenigmarchaeota archaeon]